MHTQRAQVLFFLWPCHPHPHQSLQVLPFQSPAGSDGVRGSCGRFLWARPESEEHQLHPCSLARTQSTAHLSAREAGCVGGEETGVGEQHSLCHKTWRQVFFSPKQERKAQNDWQAQ